MPRWPALCKDGPVAGDGSPAEALA